MTRFYERVPADPMLAPLFAHMDPAHAAHVAAFLAEVLGGPKMYSEEHGRPVHRLNRSGLHKSLHRDISHGMETSRKPRLALAVSTLVCMATLAARAEAAPPHGPLAADDAFPSHAFRASAHAPERPQLAFHFGLLQPVLFDGMNAAVDLRLGRFVLSYSHGHALDYSATPGLGLSGAERDAGLSLRSPWTTGGGVGFTLIDELYVMLDVKVHRYAARTPAARADYTTVSVGAELGYRLFAWKGLFVQPMLRFWPNVWTSLPDGYAQLGELRHDAKDLGFFANVSIGWASSL